MLKNEIFHTDSYTDLLKLIEEYKSAYNKRYNKNTGPGVELVVRNIIPLRTTHWNERQSNYDDGLALQESQVVDAYVIFETQRS